MLSAQLRETVGAGEMRRTAGEAGLAGTLPRRPSPVLPLGAHRIVTDPELRVIATVGRGGDLSGGER
jgi:hypothetical protein